MLPPLASSSAPFRKTDDRVTPSEPPVPKTFTTRPLLASADEPRFIVVLTRVISGVVARLANCAPLVMRRMRSVDVMLELVAFSSGPLMKTPASVPGVPETSEDLTLIRPPNWFWPEIGSNPPVLIDER